MSYIYKITNDINGKIYIGKTQYSNPEKRWKEHLSDYKREMCEKRPLYSAMNKYGIEHFSFEVIEETNKPEEREQYWIDELRTYVGFDDCNGYNATLGGDGKSYLNLDENEVIQYHTEDAIYSLGATADYFNVDHATIAIILNKHNIPWLKQCDKQNMRIYQEYGGVLQIDPKSMMILNIFENVKCASLYMGKDKKNSNINHACNGNRKNHRAYGYLWYYGKDLPLIQDKIVNYEWL